MIITGNTILVTGGGSGIGQALAVALQAAGNRVIITGRREALLAATAAAHPGMDYAVLDVEDPAAIAVFAERIKRSHPDLNVLINNAGIMAVEDLSADPCDTGVAEATITTNVLGPIRLTAALLPHLRRQREAHIVNVSSGLAFVPLAITPTYSASKAAMHAYTQSLRAQLKGTSVSVLELIPPAVATDLMPGQRDNPQAMPLADFISETMQLLAAPPPSGEINVERVKMLRFAEANGQHDMVFGLVNGPR